MSAARERVGKALVRNIDETSLSFLVVNGPCDLTDLISSLESHLGCGRVATQLRAMHFQPQSLWTLPKGDQL